MSLRPFVFWAQTETDIFLKVDVKKVQGEPDVCIEEEEIEFTARGIGKHFPSNCKIQAENISVWKYFDDIFRILFSH